MADTNAESYDDFEKRYDEERKKAVAAVADRLKKYEIRKFRSFQGREGLGYNLELWLDGKKHAFVLDEGNGGCSHVDLMSDEARTLWESIIKEAAAAVAGRDTYSVTDTLLVTLVSEFETLRRWKRQAKTQTLVQIGDDIGGDQYIVIKAPFSPKVKAEITKRHAGKPIRWINEEVARAV